MRATTRQAILQRAKFHTGQHYKIRASESTAEPLSMECHCAPNDCAMSLFDRLRFKRKKPRIRQGGANPGPGGCYRGRAVETRYFLSSRTSIRHLCEFVPSVLTDLIHQDARGAVFFNREDHALVDINVFQGFFNPEEHG
jgi:hypothetical protein